MPDGSSQNLSQPTRLLDRLPPHILGSLTAEQKIAISAAARETGWQKHSVNIRFNVPMIGRKWYLTLVGGPERRGPARQRIERTRHPLRTIGNLVFVIASAILFYGLAVTTVLFTSDILSP